MLPVCPLCLTNPIAWGLLLVLGLAFILLWVLTVFKVKWAEQTLSRVKGRMKKIMEGFKK